MKHKLVSRYGVTKYCIKGKKDQQLDEMAVQKLRNREVPGLLPVDADRKKNSFQLIYDVTGLTSLDVFLRQPMTKSVFIRLVKNILTVYTAVPDSHLELSKVHFDKESIFVNPSSHELFYIYVPIGGCDYTVTLRDLLLTVTSSCLFSPGEENDYVACFMQFIKDRPNLSKLELYTFLGQLEEKRESTINLAQKPCPYCGGLVVEDSDFCTNCGKQLTGDSQKTEHIYNPFPDIEGSIHKKGMTDSFGNGGFNSEIEEDLLPGNDKEWGQSGGHGTTLLGDLSHMPCERKARTELLDQDEQNCACLIRRRTGERMEITGSSFRIGSDPNQCDYVVPDSRVVSRNHAEIFQEGGVYTIQDNASTNGTYLNGKRIESYQKTELEHKAKLRLANEDFIFYIEEGEKQ